MMTANRTISEEMSLSEIEEICKSKIDNEVWNYIQPSETGSTYRRNIDSFNHILLKQRMFRGISTADTSVEMFGQKISTPIFVGPVGSFSRIGIESEFEVVTGCGKAGSMLFVAHPWLSELETLAQIPMRPPLIFQGLMTSDYEELKVRIKQAESLGFVGVGLTVDTVVPTKHGEQYQHGNLNLKPVTLDDIRKVRKETRLPLVIKGIMSEEDALLAVDAGADVIFVSNHGGRLLDYSRATIEVLPQIVKAVKNRADVIVDGGFRRGTDVLKAVALGAKAVAIGRPAFWGVAAGGSDGVSTIITKLTEELRRCMVICGLGSLQEASESILC